MRYLVFFVFLWSTVFAQTDTTKLDIPVLPQIGQGEVSLPSFVPLTAPDLPQIGQEEISLPSFVSLTAPDLPQSGVEGWLNATKLAGGINHFSPKDKLPSNQAWKLVNLLPYGDDGWKKREGYQKIMITSLGTIYGLAMADSGKSKSRLVAAGGGDLYYTDSLYNGTYVDFGNTTAVPTYFTSTPFGLVISNDGEDSCRIWEGDTSAAFAISALGVCDTGRVSLDWTISTDTVWIVDSSRYWVPDYWIGYYLRFTSSDSLWRIIDNGPDSILAITTASGDTNRTGQIFSIISQPDSMSGDLTYPRGQAVAYYQQRLMVSSAWYPNRIYYSRERLPNEIDIDAIIDLDMGSLDKIQRMILFNGYLIVFGSNSIYVINSSLQAFLVTNAIGCSTPKSIAVGDDYVYFLAQPTGVYRFNSNIFASISYKPEKISDPVQDILASVEANVLDGACGVYVNRQYWLAYSPDSCIVFDERTEQWYQQGFGFTEALSLIGDFRIQNSEVLYPNSDVSTNWSSTGANNWSVIDDQTNDADYIYGNNKTAKLAFTNLSNYATGATIHHITIGCRAKVSYWIAAEIRVSLWANNTAYPLYNFSPLTTNWQTFFVQIDENPITEQAWTKGDIDSLVLQIVGYVKHGHTDYVSGLWVIPSYRSDLPAHDFMFFSTRLPYLYQYGGIFTDDTSHTGTYDVAGKDVEVFYQSGWFNGGSLLDRYMANRFYLDKMIDGASTVYLYKDFESAAVETLNLANTSDTTAIEWVTPELRGNHFSVGIESSARTCEIKGWGLLLQVIGER